MNPIDQLVPCTGIWHGISRLQDPETNQPEESASVMTIMPVLGGRFVRLDYTWSYQGSPQEGSLLVGYEAGPELVTAHWIDTWHMGDRAMECWGTGAKDGEIAVVGRYAAPPGPDWGWRIELTYADEQTITLVMTNIMPDGEESLAVEASYSRE